MASMVLVAIPVLSAGAAVVVVVAVKIGQTTAQLDQLIKKTQIAEYVA